MSIKFTKPDIGFIQTTSIISNRTAVDKVLNRAQVLYDAMNDDSNSFVSIYHSNYSSIRIEIRNFFPNSTKNERDTIFVKLTSPIHELSRLNVSSAIGFGSTSNIQESIHSFKEYVNQQLFGSLNNLTMDVYDFALNSKIEFDTKEDRIAFTRVITSTVERDESVFKKIDPFYPGIIKAKTIGYIMINHYNHSFCYNIDAFHHPKNHAYRGYYFSKFCIRRMDDTSINFEIYLTPSESRHSDHPLNLNDFNIQELQMYASSIIKDIFTDSVFYNEIPHLKEYIDQLEYNPRYK